MVIRRRRGHGFRFGGVSADTNALVSLRLAVEIPAPAEIRRAAHMPTPLSVAVDLAHERKRKAHMLVQATGGRSLPLKCVPAQLSMGRRLSGQPPYAEFLH